MSRTLRGKCWIYKRATLYRPDKAPRIIDYANGVEEFDCDSVLVGPQGLFYNWYLLPDQFISIPLNIPRNRTESIVKTGVIPFEDGEIRWEYIFGKFMTYGDYNWSKFMEYLPLLLLILILIIRILI